MGIHQRPLSALAFVVLGMLYVFPYSRSLNNPNDRTRVLQARALADSGSLAIGEVYRQKRRGRSIRRVRDLYGRSHRDLFVNDVAVVCVDGSRKSDRCSGPIYPAKAPGAALLAAPPLAVAARLGWLEPGPAGEERAHWIARYFGLVLPLIGCLLAFIGWLRRAGLRPDRIAKGVIAAGLGTQIFPYGIAAVGHVLAGGCLVAGVYLLMRAGDGRKSFLWALAGGAVSAFAVLLEYHAAIAVLCVAVWVLLTGQRRRLMPGYAVGSLIMAGSLGALHQKMFLSPLRTGHYFLASAHNRAGQAKGFLGMDGLHWESLRDHMVDPYMGLIPLMPWLAAGLIICVVGRGVLRAAPTAVVGANRALFAMVAMYLLFISSLGEYRWMNGWSIGPRYLGPAMFPLALLGVQAWARTGQWGRSVFTGLAIASVWVMGSITGAYPSPPDTAGNVLAEVAYPLLSEGYMVRNAALWFGHGELSVYFFGAYLFVAALWLAWPAPGSRTWAGRLAGPFLALALGCSWMALLGAPEGVPNGARKPDKRHLRFLKKTLEGAKGFDRQP